MAKINEGAFKQWLDGQTITAGDYKMEHEIIKTAVNDNDERIKVLETAQGGALRKLPVSDTYPSAPEVGYVIFRPTVGYVYVLGKDSQWRNLAWQTDLDLHREDEENPHNTTAEQVGAYSKQDTYKKTEVYNRTESDAKYMNAGGARREVCPVSFFTNGGSPTATASYTFKTPFTENPVIEMAAVNSSIPYSDTLYAPRLTALSKTGFTVAIKAAGNLGTVGTPANLFIDFIATGK